MPPENHRSLPSPRLGSSPSPSLPFDHVHAAEVRAHVAKFAVPSDLYALLDVLATIGIWLLCWKLPWYLAPLQGLPSIRLFVVCVHDTGHRNLFSKLWMNRLVGTLVAPATSFAYNYWAVGHDYHHAHSNDLNFEQWSQSAPITARELRTWPAWKRSVYRFLSIPIMLVWAGGPFSIVVLQPLQTDTALDWAMQLSWWAVLLYTGSVLRYLSFIVPVAALGLFLFHAQHTFPDTVRYEGLSVKGLGTPDEAANLEGLYRNAIEGSSLLLVPEWLKPFTARIEYHHIHHLNAKVPSYNLRQCHESARPGLWKGVKELTFAEACVLFLLLFVGPNDFLCPFSHPPLASFPLQLLNTAAGKT